MTKKYCKVIDEEKGLVQVGTGTNDKYYQSIGFIQQDVVEVDNVWYLKGKEPEPDIDKQKQQLRQELENTFYNTYPLYKQCNIAIYGTEEERKEFKEFHDEVVGEYDKKIEEIDNKTGNKQ